jgi:hypothetical protein
MALKKTTTIVYQIENLQDAYEANILTKNDVNVVRLGEDVVEAIITNLITRDNPYETCLEITVAEDEPKNWLQNYLDGCYVFENHELFFTWKNENNLTQNLRNGYVDYFWVAEELDLDEEAYENDNRLVVVLADECKVKP